MIVEHFRLFSNCILVHGANNAAIYDLHRGRILKLNQRIASLIDSDFLTMPMAHVKEKYPDWSEGIDSYIGMLTDNDFGHITDEPQRFPPLSMEYHVPRTLDSAIIVYNPELCYDHLIDQLSELGCQYIQLIVLKEITDLDDYSTIISQLNSQTFKQVEIIINRTNIDLQQILMLGNNLAFNYKVYNATEENQRSFDKLLEINQDLFLLTKKSCNLTSSTEYSEDNMIINLAFFLEAQHHNTGLNQKICIDYDGNIKNYLSFSDSFGKLDHDQLENVIAHTALQEQWHIPNSEIEKCKVCIYRYACNSTSKIIRRDDKFHKAEDCGYDPYTDVWKI